MIEKTERHTARVKVPLPDRIWLGVPAMGYTPGYMTVEASGSTPNEAMQALYRFAHNIEVALREES